VNITVVGAGIIGCAVAHELASRGARVRVVDMRGPGLGATQASAGILAPHVEGHIDALLRLGVCSLSLYDAFVARAVKDGSQPVEYERSGTLQVALDADQAAALEAAAKRLAANGVACTLMHGDAARALEPSLSPRICAALLVPQHGYVRVGELTSALAAAAVSAGTTTTMATMRRVESRESVVTVTTSAGDIEGDAVILAAGSWTSTIAQPLATPPAVRPVRGQLLHLHFNQRPLSRVVWGTGCYLVPWHDGSLLVGATVEEAGFDETATAAGVTHLLESAGALLAATPTARFDAVRVGLRPGTPDELPLIGPSSTMRGVYYAAGHYRNGVLLAPLTAKLVADLVLDGRRAPELELVRPDRFGL
jgi:glycine oxidase